MEGSSSGTTPPSLDTTKVPSSRCLSSEVIRPGTAHPPASTVAEEERPRPSARERSSSARPAGLSGPRSELIAFLHDVMIDHHYAVPPIPQLLDLKETLADAMAERAILTDWSEARDNAITATPQPETSHHRQRMGPTRKLHRHLVARSLLRRPLSLTGICTTTTC